MRARRSVAVLSGATLAITLAMAGSGALSTANASGPVAQDAGTLALTTTSGTGVDGWSFTRTGNVSGTPDATQAVGAVAGTCTLTPTTGPLVTLTGTNGSVGYANHSIGVTQGVTNSSCNRVGINKTTTKVGKTNVTTTTVEALSLALNNGTGGALADPTFGSFQASGATLDLEVHEGTKVQAAVSLAGGTPTVYTLIAYDADDAKPSSLAPNTTWCVIADDDEHATGAADNCSWTIPGPNFDKVVLTPVAGWFSLEGGGDWPAASGDHRSTFSMVSFFDGSLATCDGTSSATTFGGGAVTGAVLTRIANNDPSQACAPLPYTFTTGGGFTTFHKPTPAGDTSQFAIAITRFYSAAPNPVPAAKVDWEDVIPTGPQDLHWCVPGVIGGVVPNPDSSGTPFLPTNVAFPLPAAAADQSPDALGGKPGTQYACIYKQSPAFDVVTGSLTVIDYIYFTGDIKFPSA